MKYGLPRPHSVRPRNDNECKNYKPAQTGRDEVLFFYNNLFFNVDLIFAPRLQVVRSILQYLFDIRVKSGLLRFARNDNDLDSANLKGRSPMSYPPRTKRAYGLSISKTLSFHCQALRTLLG